MDIRKVKKLIELLEASSVDEIEIKEGEESVRISRNTAAPVMAAAPAMMPAPARSKSLPSPVCGPTLIQVEQLPVKLLKLKVDSFWPSCARMKTIT